VRRGFPGYGRRFPRRGRRFSRPSRQVQPCQRAMVGGGLDDGRLVAMGTADSSCVPSRRREPAMSGESLSIRPPPGFSLKESAVGPGVPRGASCDGVRVGGEPTSSSSRPSRWRVRPTRAAGVGRVVFCAGIRVRPRGSGHPLPDLEVGFYGRGLGRRAARSGGRFLREHQRSAGQIGRAHV